MRFIQQLKFIKINLNFKNLNYSVDTWKLLNIERILINIKNNIYLNKNWIKPLIIKKNYFFLNFINYIYILNFYSTIIYYAYIYYNNLTIKYFEYLNNYNVLNFYPLNNIFLNNIFLNNIFLNFFKFFKKFNFKIMKLNYFINKPKFTFIINKNKFKIIKIKILKNIKKINYIVSKNIYIFKPLVFYTKNNLNINTLLKKQKIYTKNKYSRSRQYCKNIVLLGLLLNIILMFGLNSAYYAILLNIHYFIHIIYFFIFCFSIFLFKKYNLFNINQFK